MSPSSSWSQVTRQHGASGRLVVAVHDPVLPLLHSRVAAHDLAATRACRHEPGVARAHGPLVLPRTGDDAVTGGPVHDHRQTDAASHRDDLRLYDVSHELDPRVDLPRVPHDGDRTCVHAALPLLARHPSGTAGGSPRSSGRSGRARRQNGTERAGSGLGAYRGRVRSQSGFQSGSHHGRQVPTSRHVQEVRQVPQGEAGRQAREARARRADHAARQEARSDRRSRATAASGVIGTSAKENEHRLPLHPDHLTRIRRELRRRITLEHGYGARFGHADRDLRRLVAGFATRDEIIATSDVVVLPKPQHADVAR